MTACLISAVQGFSHHYNIQPGSHFSGCQGLIAMGMFKWLGADLSLAEFFISGDFIFCANICYLAFSSCAHF
jgi:hypothetical protein